VSELPPLRDSTQVQITASADKWLKIADALEEVGHDKWLAGQTNVKEEEYVFECQTATQIRIAVGESEPD
jgi:hypothetical protein